MKIEETLAGSAAPAHAGPLPAGLRVSLLDASGRALAVTKSPVSIGRKNADVLVNDPTVSTLHAVLERAGEGFLLTDKGSTNGTFVNGKRVTAPHAVSNLDEVKLGEALFTFSVVEDRFGLHHEAAATHAETQHTLLIASAPTVSPIPAGKTYLLGYETGGIGQSARLAMRITTIGRSEGDINIEDLALSRKHFQIEVHADRIAVKDLGSANGTHVEGKPVSYAVVTPGQTFVAGRTRFRVDVKG
jgi:pSer/pThr/pTyr-binding forkhead associated (FHA) protein